jgi:hypothetical protein
MTNIFDRMLDEFDQANLMSPESNTVPPAEEASTTEPEADKFITPIEVKQISQELLKHGYIEESKRSDLFRRALALSTEVMKTLEPLDLEMKIDSHRGLAFLTTVNSVPFEESEDESQEQWSHPLVRRQRLTLEQSLLVAILRQAFVMHEQEYGVGSREATIAVDELLPQFLVYLKDSGSDSKNESRMLSLLDQLKTYGIVSEVDKKQEVTIRPLIAHLANPESLAALLRVMESNAKDNPANSVNPDEADAC